MASSTDASEKRSFLRRYLLENHFLFINLAILVALALTGLLGPMAREVTLDLGFPENEKEFVEQMLERFIPQTILDLDEDDMMQDELQSGPRCALSMDWDVLENYIYEEWDARIKDYKSEWCKVYEVLPRGTSSEFYQNTIEQYKNEISLINRIFKMIKPESFTKLRRQTDGDIGLFLYLSSSKPAKARKILSSPFAFSFNSTFRA